MSATPRDMAPDPTSETPARIRGLYLHYGCAVVSAALALAARVLLSRYLGTQFPFATVYFAVILTAWYAGWRPALLATLLCYLGVAYFIIPPYHTFVLHSLSDYIGAGIYLFFCVSSIFFSEAQRSAQTRAEASAQEARSRQQAMQASEARKTAILETALDAILIMDHEGKIVEFNPAAERMFGRGQAETLGREMAELLIPPAFREPHRKGLTRYLATGEGPVLGKRIELSALRAGGMEFPVELAITRIPGEGPPLFSGYIRDITARRKAERQQRFLTEASDLLASSLDYQTTLQSVARLVVPHLADWCVIDMAGENGAIQHVAVTHADPDKIALAHQLDARYPSDPQAAVGVPQVIRSGKPEMLSDIPDDLMRAMARDAEHYQILETLGLKSYLCVPLIISGRSIGAITFIGAESGHRYGPDDLTLAEELARRAAIAIDNARLYQAERERSAQLSSAIAEVHHRVKNSLQSVGALLEMQLPDAGNSVPVEAVQDSLSQIKTIALVHDLLARDKPIGSVNAAQVLTNLAQLLSSSMSAGQQQMQVIVDAEPVEMTTKTATALALAINELLTNAAKHQDAPRQEDSLAAKNAATIHITLRRSDESILAAVQDNGPGFPPNFDPLRDAHVGLELVQTLVTHDLHGTIHFRNAVAPEDPAAARGGYVEITFPQSVCAEE